MKQIRQAIADGSFLLDPEVESIEDVYRQAAAFLQGREKLSNEQREEVANRLREREMLDSTAVGNAFAVPHLYGEWFTESSILFIRLRHPLMLGAPDGAPTRFFFVLLGPSQQAGEHLDLLMHVAQLMSDEEFRYEAGAARNQTDLLEAIDHFLSRTAPEEPEPPQPFPEELARTGKLGGGLSNDIRRRAPHYLGDFREGLSTKTLSSVLFLVFACLAPSIAFGGLMEKGTEGQMGTVEMLLACACCGVVYALFSGQPLIILGGTGPLLAFTLVLYNLCDKLPGVEFLPTFAWVGLWTMLFLIIAAVTDLSYLMRYFTRFTDEIFAALISVIFITNAIIPIATVVHRAYLHEKPIAHEIALLSVILAFGTFYLAMNLSGFRRSRYLRPQVREFLADFGPTIALLVMTAVAFYTPVDQEKLNAPSSFGTTSGRSWLIEFWNAPPLVIFGSIIPALFAAILLYLDQNITSRLVNSSHHRLRKGGGYHLDLIVVGVLVGFCSLFGLPWHVAATVRSLNHVRSLATTEVLLSRNNETKERIIHVCENRVSGLLIHLLIGASLFLLPYLREIPMAVLYGLFLYMGIVSMRGNQFFERLSLWPMDRDLYPVTHYLRRAPLRVIHAFTFIQLICLALLWVVKESVIGILFPLMIALLAPLRFFLDRFYDSKHLEVLDLQEDPEDEEEDWQ